MPLQYRTGSPGRGTILFHPIYPIHKQRKDSTLSPSSTFVTRAAPLISACTLQNITYKSHHCFHIFVRFLMTKSLCTVSLPPLDFHSLKIKHSSTYLPLHCVQPSHFCSPLFPAFQRLSKLFLRSNKICFMKIFLVFFVKAKFHSISKGLNV